MSSAFYFFGDKIYADSFINEITPSLKANDGLKFSQDVAFNNVREKGKPQYKLSYKVLQEEDVYDPLLDIYPYQALIHLKD